MNRFAMLAAAAAIAFSPVSGAFAEAAHKLAIHVDENDPAVMNLALNNAQNVQNYYKGKGETVEIEIVTYGPGLHMFMADSPVKDRLSTMAMESDNLKFAACANTMAAMEKKTGKKPEILSEAAIVPSGVIRLIELQEGGYSYLRP